MNNSDKSLETNKELTGDSMTSKTVGTWRTWATLILLLLLLGAGVVVWGILSFDVAENRVAIEVAETGSLEDGRFGEHNRIPIRVVNRIDRPIRIVGNNAC